MNCIAQSILCVCASPPSILVGLQVQLQHCTTYGAFKNWIQSETSVKHWQQHLPLETKEVLPCLPLFCFVLPDEHVHLWQFYLAPSEPNKSSKIAIWVLFYCYQMNLTVSAPLFFVFSIFYLCLPCSLWLIFELCLTNIASSYFSFISVACTWLNLPLSQSHQQTFNAAFSNPNTLCYSSPISCLSGCCTFLAILQQSVQTLNPRVHWDITYC